LGHSGGTFAIEKITPQSLMVPGKQNALTNREADQGVAV